MLTARAEREASAATTGPRIAGAVVSSGAGWSGTFTLANLNSSNNVRAVDNIVADYGILSTFAFGVPAGSRVDGISVNVEGSASGAPGVDYAVQLSWDGGASWTAVKAGNFGPVPDTTALLGGVADTWGRTWTLGELSDATFQLRIYKSGSSSALQVDRIQVSVEYQPPVAVFYSVGTSSADLKSGSPTVTIASGSATFSVPQPANVGVGDVVSHSGGTLVYITGRTSATVYSVATATGAAAANVAGAPVDSIRRAFNSLSAAQAGSSDALHLNLAGPPYDLIAGHFELHWPCYNDGPMNDNVNVTGWTTDAFHYIRVFTPFAANQAGVSQRHTGTAGTGFRLTPVASGSNLDIVNLDVGHVRVEGLEIDGSGVTNAQYVRGVRVQQGLSNVGDIRIDSSIIHDLHTTADGWPTEGSMGILGLQTGANLGPPLIIANNFIYDITSTANSGHIAGIHVGSRATSYVYNNTVLGINNIGGGASGGPAWGIYARAWPELSGVIAIATNNYVGSVAAPQSTQACYGVVDGGVLVPSYNVSSDATASGIGSQTNRSAYSTYFQSVANGSENLHLTATSAALWAAPGTDLFPSVRYDADRHIRSAPWDIGADEFTTAADPLIVYSDNQAAGSRPLSYTTYSGGAWAAPGVEAVPGPFPTAADWPLYNKVARTRPDGLRREVLFAEADSGTRNPLHASFWDGTSWTDGAGALGSRYLGPSGDATLLISRHFDAAIEQQSGDLVVVSGTNTDESVDIFVHTGSSWTANLRFIPPGNGTMTNQGEVAPVLFRWMRLAPRPGTNQIGLLALAHDNTQTSGAVHAAIWDGNSNSFGSKAILSLPVTDGQNANPGMAIDIAYVLGGSSGGEAIAVWGNGARVYSARWSQASGWSASAQVADLGVGNTVRWLRLAAKPRGDRMALAIEDTNQRLFTQTYDATSRTWSALSAALSTTAYGSAVFNRPFDLVWDTAAGPNSLLLAYSDTTRVRFRTSNDAGATWSAQQNQDAGTLRQAYWIQLVRDPTNLVHLAMQDATNALQVYTWNGSAWLTPAVQVSANTERDANHAVEPFSIATFAPLASFADLGIAKDDGQATAVPGTAISYTITVTNNGPDTVTSLFVNDVVPAGITGAAFTPSTGAYNSGTGEWTGLNLAATQSVVLSLSGTIDPFARGTLTNTASVAPPASAIDPNGTNDVASDVDALDPSADVQLVKSDSLDPAPLGEVLTYTLTVTNNGPSGATNVDVSDTLPVDMELDGAPAAAIAPSQGTCNYTAATRVVSCSLGSVGPTLGATVTVRVRPTAVKSYLNTASVTRSEADPVAANNSEGETTLVELSGLGVRFFTATSTSQRNVLEWVNPTDADYLTTEIMVRSGAFPTGPSDPLATSLYNANGGGSGGRMKLVHGLPAPPLTNGQTYYYGAFVHRLTLPVLSPGRFVTGRPFDHTSSPVKWAFSTGATALAAPTVGGAGVIATSNDRVVYAMERGIDDDFFGIDSGEWPASFRPQELQGVVQLRSPVVPVTVGTANPVAFLGAQDGRVYVVDATQGGAGSLPWSSTPVGPMLQAAPAGIFAAFGGGFDQLLVGTRDGTNPNAFFALDPFTGGVIDSYDNGGAGAGAIGIVSGMAALDYPASPPRAYFTSYERLPIGSTNTLWAFGLSATATPTVFNPIWAKQLGNIDSSPVVRGGRVLVGSPQGGGTIHSFEALLGGGERTFIHGNGQVKGFVFPDRLSPTGDIYFATDDFVWGLTEIGSLLDHKFTGPIALPGGARPSAVLFVPASHYLYVGGSDGKLYELDTLMATPVPKPVTLGNGLAVVGAPSLDRAYNLVHVGTEAGIFYAVQVPLP